jgi:hypothetical protein
MRFSAFIFSGFILAGLLPDARAQLGGTNLDGIRIDVRAIYRSGDSRDLDCVVRLEFAGEKMAGAMKMSQVRVLQAVDDTGADLVRTNKHRHEWGASPPMRSVNGFSQTIDLKTPSTNAHVIKRLEGETEIFTTTANPPVFTNFAAQTAGILRHPMLDQYQVKLSYQIRELTNGLIIPPDKKIEVQADDPQAKLVSLVFQKTDGSLLRAISTSSSTSNPHFTSAVYDLSGVSSRDLKLLVNLATPEASQTVRFKLENIRLPWFDPPDLNVTATDVTRIDLKKTNLYACRLLLTFAGGRVASSAGIRELFISRAESDTGQKFKINNDYRWMMNGFDGLGVNGAGRSARKWVPLEIATNNVKSIRILEGEAELYFPNFANNGIVSFNDFLSHPGEPLATEALTRCRVKLVFLGRDNFATKRKDWLSQRTVLTGGLPPGQSSEVVKDSLHFSVDDPEKRIIKIEFLNQKGEPLIALAQMNSSETHSLTALSYQLYGFKTPPPDGTQLRIWLATPESLECVRFKVENIPL